MMDPSQHRGPPSHLQPRDHRGNGTSSNNHDNSNPRVRFAEEDAEPSRKVYQPTPRHQKLPAAASSATPAVYWDDRDNDANLAQYTFYREGTPTPPELEGERNDFGHGRPLDASVASSSAAGGGAAAGSEHEYNNGPVSLGGTSVSDSNGNPRMSPTKKKKIIRAIIVIGVLIIIGIAVGVGVGLGVGLANRPAEQQAGGASSSPPATMLDLSPTETTSNSRPSAVEVSSESATSTTSEPRPKYNSDCPALNNTIYHVPGSTKSFLRLCGIDYSGSGATDFAHAYTKSMAECMHTCASSDLCTGCSWGYLTGDKGVEHRCYMKKDLKMAHQAAGDWCFAILQ